MQSSRWSRLFAAVAVWMMAAVGLCAAIPANLQITNQATTAYTDFTGQPQARQSRPVVVVVTDQADLAVSKTGPVSVNPTNRFSYSITVINHGPLPAVSVVVTDSLPANLTFISATAGGTTNASLTNVFWTVSTLASGAVVNLGLTVQAPAIGVVSNWVGVGSSTADTNLVNNSAGPILTIVNAQADLAVGKAGPASVNAGTSFSYTITVTNNGPAAASSIVVTDNLPANVTFISATGGGQTNASAASVFWTVSNLASGAVASLGLTLLAPARGTLSNSVVVGSSTADVNLGNNSAGPILTTVIGQADLAVSKTGPANAAPNSQFSYAISVTNNGPSTAVSVVVTDSLPANVTFISATGGGTTNASLTNVFWTVGSLASGAVVNFGLTVQAPDSGVISNWVVAGSVTADANLGNNSAGPILTTVIGQADLAVTKTGPASAVGYGQFSYTITMTNNGPSMAVSVVVTDSLPVNVTFISATGGGTTNASLTNVFWTVGNLASGSVASLGLTVRAPASGVVSNWVLAGSLTADANLGNNRAGPVLTTVIELLPAPTLTKSVAGTNAVPGAQVQFTLVAGNSGSTNAAPIPVVVNGTPNSLVIVRDAIPLKTTFVQFNNIGSGTALYHRAGDPLQTYGLTAPADLTQVDAIAVGYGTLPVGAASTITFTVQVNSNAAGSISNIGQIDYANVTGGVPHALDSNLVTLPITVTQPPTITYYYDTTYTTTALVYQAGSPAYVQAQCQSCIHNPGIVETATITITSQLTGDSEAFTATETGPGTGLFQIRPFVPTTLTLGSGTPGNGTIETRPNDILTATISGGSGSATAITKVMIDPNGVVFDSRSNQPIAGATVTLIDVTGQGNHKGPNQPALVFAGDGVTTNPATVTTGPAGTFQFLLVPESTYKFLITPPAGYQFPSQVPVSALPPNRVVSTTASYGGQFPVLAALGTVKWDVPMDSALPPGTGLFIEKTASRPEAEVGDVVTYSVQIKNLSSNTIAGVTLADVLPAGFAYQHHSAATNGVATVDPVGGKGPRLKFAIGSIAGGDTVTLTYRTLIGVGALQGTGKNRAQATAPGTPPPLSNVSIATVKVQPGVFTDQAFIIGKVFVDLNHNQIQDDGEPGVPSVRIYMEDGTYIVTDSEGKYSLYGLSPRTHVLKVDEMTLPPGARLEALTPRHDSRGLTCLADLKRGEMRKVNFAIVSPEPRVLEEVKRRRVEAAAEVVEIQQALTHELTAATAPLPAAGSQAQTAAGTTSAVLLPQTTRLPNSPTATLPTPVYTSMIEAAPLTSRNSLLPARPVAVVPRGDLEDALLGVSGELGFVDLKDHDTLPIAIANVRIKGPSGAKFALKLNGRLVSEQQVGKRIEMPTRHLAGWEYIGIELQPGPNTLEVQQADPFGNVHSTKITVTAPGNLGKIQIVPPKGDQSADGMTPVKILVLVQDDKGVPVTARTLVTIESSLGRWQVTDLNPDEPGVQTVIENGAAEFTLLPPQDPGDAKIVVSSGILRDTAVLPFLPALRPLLAVGIVEGRLNLRNLDLNHLIAARPTDGFEQELRDWTFGSDGGRVEGGGRVAMFIKGKIKGDYLLTLAYDSDKETQQRLFRDIQPDSFYPVYGDSGGRGFDAQSTGRLYIRVDKRKSYLLYGDFPTAAPSEARGLGNYSRSLTGLKEHYEKANVVANAWGAYDSMKQVVQEFPADGTSGPYYFNINSAQENSEKVEIITRDRNQPAVVLKVVPMQRFVDYEFEPFAGQLLFRAPVPSVDSNLNPIFIRVTFEVDQGGKKFFVGGADAQVKLLPRWEVGGSVVDDENPTKKYQLYSANTTVKLFTNTFVLAEAAQSDSSTNGVGHAGRIELRHESEFTSARLYGAYAETNFDNPSSPVTAGRQEVGAKISQKLDKQTRLLLETIDTKQLGTSNELWGVVGGIAHTFSNNVTVEIGGRYSQETVGNATTNSVTSVRTRVTMPVPLKPAAKLTGEYENDVLHPDRRMAALGTEYQAANRSRIYAKHEFINSVGSAYELSSNQQKNTTVLGVETEYMKEGNLFNEYRMNDGINGPDAVAAMGVRNGWNIASGIKANTTFERATPIYGTNSADVATAAGLGVDYTRNPNWKATGRIEYRTSAASDHWLNTLGYARKLDEDWTMLAKSILDVSTDKNLVVTSNGVSQAGDKFQSRLQLGAAYRETRTDVWNALFLYEYKYEDLSGSASNDLRSAHIFTSHFNYQPAPELTLNGRLAFKFVNEDTSGVRNNSLAFLIGGRGMYDVTRRCSLGVNANAMFSGNLRSIQYGLGPDFGIRIHDNIWIDAGYNFIGFHDRDLSEGNYTEHGFFIGLRMQFDEHILDGLRRAKP